MALEELKEFRKQLEEETIPKKSNLYSWCDYSRFSKPNQKFKDL